MNKSLLAGVMILLATPIAHAADLPEPEPTYAAPVEAPIAAPQNKWNGAYIGALVGYGWSQFDNSGAADQNPNGFLGGLYGGYNVRIDQYVFGLEGDFAFADISESNGGISASTDWISTVRARAGVAVDDNILVYGTGGLAIADVELASAGLSDSSVLYGWTIGAGVETYLTENVTFRAEYLYTDFQDKNFNVAGGTSSDLSSHLIRAGIGYNF